MAQNYSGAIKVEETDVADTMETEPIFDSQFDPCDDIFTQYITQTGDDDINGQHVADEDDMIFVYMNIQSPIQTLKVLLQQKVQRNLEEFEVWLQNVQMLEPHKTLVDQCVKGEGLVQVNAQILYSTNRINIADVVKPTEEVLNASKVNQLGTIDIELGHLNDTGQQQPMPSTSSAITNEQTTISSQSQHNKSANTKEAKHEYVNWVVDSDFQKQKRELNMPDNPDEWSHTHVEVWLGWAINQFGLDVNENDWRLSGKELCELSLSEFQQKVPSDPGNKFWTHLELMRKCKFIAVPGNPHSMQSTNNSVVDDIIEDDDDDDDGYDEKMTMISHNPRALGARSKGFVLDSLSSLTSQGNRSGNNGQIQLWQFLLEILTNRDHRKIIEWIDGGDGEFRLIKPERVAHLWGERKNKPKMNYEKLSRALRYYYDGDMISKVSHKRFVYKFVCDLKQLTGYNAQQFSDRVNGRARTTKYAKLKLEYH